MKTSRLSNRWIESRLLGLATAYLAVYALALTLSPSARARSWDVTYRWMHWVGFLLWVGLFWLARRQLDRHLRERDPFLLPLAGLISGWGLLTVWRLSSGFGLRQTAWLLVGMLVVMIGARLPADLSFLRRYKYLWLTSGLLLTMATLFLGTNPLGAGPRLWLGCCGFYFQPSEPLKLLLIVYLSAYLADRPFISTRRTSTALLSLLAPTLLMAGLALLLLIFQRDLGTASVFLFLYAVIIYLATGDWRVVGLTLLVLTLSGILGYRLFDVVRLRVDAWLNPWSDPSGRSFQIVQSLMAVANGGLLGRGPGLGNPGLVPVVQSDFIFSALAEESGLIGSLGLLLLIALLVQRGLRAALQTADPFRRLLAAGLSAHLAAQSIWIIGGNLRLLPLTGVTLPFISYGGSSMLVSFVELLLLLRISTVVEGVPLARFSPQPYRWLAGGLMVGLSGAALAAGWWGYWRGPDLLTRTDNARRAIADRYVRRGSLLGQDSQPLAQSDGQPGSYERRYLYPDLGAVIGYIHPVYGQAGLEASLDGYLRGLQGNSGLSIWWNHLLYGQPPPGLDVRLSLHEDLQRLADSLLDGQKGALVLVNAHSGEILAMVSHPTFDANQLEAIWDKLIRDPEAPLLNRATLGLYPPGSTLGGMLLAAQLGSAAAPEFTPQLNYDDEGQTLTCALSPVGEGWGAALAAGCPGPAADLGKALGAKKLLELYGQLGLYTAPAIRLPTLTSPQPPQISNPATYVLGLPDPETGEQLLVSPLQMALAAASLSGGGLLPAPCLATAVNTPQAGWVVLPPLSETRRVFTPQAAEQTAKYLAQPGLLMWNSVALALGGDGNGYTWYLGGTLPSWQGVPLAVAVMLETADPQMAYDIGQGVLMSVLQP